MADPTTAFGPQSANYATIRPPTDTAVSAGVDTWMRDCSSPTAEDGTVITASFFNSIIANLRNLCRKAGVPLDQSDDDMVYKAVGKTFDDRFSQVWRVYVSSAGNDSNDGLSTSTPVASLRKAIEIGRGHRAVEIYLLTDIVAVTSMGVSVGQSLFIYPLAGAGNKTLTIESTAWEDWSDGLRSFFRVNGSTDCYIKNVNIVNKITEASVSAVFTLGAGFFYLSSDTLATYKAFSGAVRPLVGAAGFLAASISAFKPADATSADRMLTGVGNGQNPNDYWPWKSNVTNLAP